MVLDPVTVAQAHTELVSTDPADGAVLTAPPSRVTLTFSEDLLPGSNTISINRPDGSVAASASVEPNGSSVSMPWPADVTSGPVQIAYRVVSGDGHPVTGAIAITIATAGGASAGPASPLATPVTPEQTAAGSPVGVILGALGIAVLLVLVVVLARARRQIGRAHV